MRLEQAIQQTKPFNSEQQRLMVNIFYTQGYLEDKLKNVLKEYGLTKQQFNILRILRGAGKPISTSVIRRRLIDKMSDTTRLIARMLKKGWVAKKTCPKDKRLVDITLTPQGLEILTLMDSKSDSFVEMLSNLSEEECVMMNNLLDKLRKEEINTIDK